MGALSYARQDQHSLLMMQRRFQFNTPALAQDICCFPYLEIDFISLADLLEFVVISHIAMVVGQIES